MTRFRLKTTKKLFIGTALTWDGARWPLAKLPSAARGFLKQTGKGVSPQQLADHLSEGEVSEIRICWVSRLAGGENVLVPSFTTPEALRIPFRITQTRRFGDVLGVVYKLV